MPAIPAESVTIDVTTIITISVSIASVLITIIVALFLYYYNKKTTRFQNTKHLIDSWQSFNSLIISDEKNIESICEFYEVGIDKTDIRKLYLLFYLLNILQHEYCSAKTNMADESLALNDIQDQILKLSADKDFVLKNIYGRGLEKDFINFIEQSLNSEMKT